MKHPWTPSYHQYIRRMATKAQILEVYNAPPEPAGPMEAASIILGAIADALDEIERLRPEITQSPSDDVFLDTKLQERL